MLARTHFERVIRLYDPQCHHTLAFRYGYDPGVYARILEGWVLWLLGYPQQALRRGREALTLAGELSHPFTLSLAQAMFAMLQQMCRQAPQEQVEASLSLSTAQGFPYLLAAGTILQGWGLAEQGQIDAGMARMRQGLAALRATGAEVLQSYLLALLVDACVRGRRAEEGLNVLAEALAVVNNHAERFFEAELHRLKGELLLAVAADKHQEAEACFQHALDVSRRQQAKSLELRAALSLSRLWQYQGKRDKARQVLAEVYSWFTEGLDNADLQEARALLEELSR